MASINTSLVDVFEQLQNRKVKIQALDQLLDNLTHDRIRFLQAKISTVDFRSDLVQKLPFELCYQVFQNLEVYQIFQAQRVSRKWSQILSSPQIVEPLALRPWLGNSGISSRASKALFQRALNLSDNNSPNREASLRARHIDSFRNGTAFSMAVGLWKNNDYKDIFPTYMRLAGSILAWTYQSMGCIQLKLLVSAQTVSLFTPKREKIGRFATSKETIVALTLSGKCCAWGYELWGANHLNALRHMFYFVMVTSDEKYIIFFERVFDESTYVRFTKMNLKGQIESSGCMEHPNIGNYIIQPESRTPAYTTGCVTIWPFAGRRQELDSHQANPTPWEVLRVCYDTNTDRLELQRHTLECSTRVRLSTRDFLWWNDVAYFGSYAHRAGELEVLDLKASVCKKAEMSASILVPGIREPSMDTGVCFGKPFHAPDSLLLGNESFVISVQPDYYIAWCFEDIKLPGEHKDYRAMMLGKKKQRFEDNKHRKS